MSRDRHLDDETFGKMGYSLWVGAIICIVLTTALAVLCLPNAFAAVTLMLLVRT